MLTIALTPPARSSVTPPCRRLTRHLSAGSSPYSVGGAGTPGPMMSPPPADMGYNMSMNGSQYNSQSQVSRRVGSFRACPAAGLTGD